MEHASALRAQAEQLEGFKSLLDDASTAVELLELEVRVTGVTCLACYLKLQ